jgi:hypothetical protein
MTTEQTVDQIIEARNEHFLGNIDTTEFVTRIGNAVNEAKREVLEDVKKLLLIHRPYMSSDAYEDLVSDIDQYV